MKKDEIIMPEERTASAGTSSASPASPLLIVLLVVLPIVAAGAAYYFAPGKMVEVEKEVPIEDKEMMQLVADQEVRIAELEQALEEMKDFSDIAVFVDEVSPEGDRFLLKVKIGDCYQCDLDSAYNYNAYVYNKETDFLSPLQKIADFEWIQGGFKFKPLPEDESQMDCPTDNNGEIQTELCEPNTEEIEWIAVADN